MLSALIEKTRRDSSPTRFSDISLKRYKKKTRSKKCRNSGFISADEESSLKERSSSVCALSPRDDASFPHVHRLDTVEAKMASIESSLSPSRNGHKLVPVVVSTGCSPSVINGKVAPSHLADSATASKLIENLKATSDKKDRLIHSLRSQLVVARQQLVSGDQTVSSQGGQHQQHHRRVCDRINELQQQIQQKRALIKNLKLSLDKLDTADNIDQCIRQAELEYEVEREELNLLNLQAEAMALKSDLTDAEDSFGGGSVSLTSCLPSGVDISLHVLSVSYNRSAPCFSVSGHSSGCGVLVDRTTPGCRLLKGDRFLEVNGTNVFGCGREQFARFIAQLTSTTPPPPPLLPASQPSQLQEQQQQQQQRAERLSWDSDVPLQLLVVRCSRSGEQTAGCSRREQTVRAELARARQEVAMLAERLEHKTSENKQLHAEKERCSRQADTQMCDNIRLSHRIGYLEECVHELHADLDKIKGVTDKSLRRNKNDVCIVVATKGPHTATIPVNVERPAPYAVAHLARNFPHPRGHSHQQHALPHNHQHQQGSQTVVAPVYVGGSGGGGRVSCTSDATNSTSGTTSSPFSGSVSDQPDASPVYQNVPPVVHERQQRAVSSHCAGATTDTSSGTEEPCLTDSEAATLRVTADGGVTRPRPPRKPARLSLQRAVSVQSIQSALEMDSANATGVGADDKDLPCVVGLVKTRRSQLAALTGVQTWPSVDQHLNHSSADRAALTATSKYTNKVEFHYRKKK